MRYLFKHVLMRDAVYDMQLRRRLRDLHRRAAEAIEELHAGDLASYYADLAFHYENAESKEKAIEYLHKAGDYARETYAVEQAIDYYRRALASLETSEGLETFKVYTRQVALYEGLGQVLWWQAQYAGAVEACIAMRTAAEAAGDAIAQARAWNRLAKVQDGQGDFRAVLESTGRAEEIARAAGVRVELAKALYGKGWAFHRLGDSEVALAVGEEALALSTELDSQHEMAHSLNLLGSVYLTLGHYEQAAHYMEKALTLFQGLDDQVWVVVMLSNLGENARERGDYRAAVARYQNALTIACKIGFRDGELLCLNNLGGARVGLGEYHAAETNLRRVIRMAEAVGAAAFLSETYSFLAKACLGQEKTEEGLAAARQSLAVGQEVESQNFIGAAWRALGMIAAKLPEPIAINENVYDAVACFAGSSRIFTEMGAEGERARTLRAWARYEIEKGDREHGETMWQEAQEIFERLGMAPEVERMEQGEELDGGR